MVASAVGNVQILRLLLKNKTIKLDTTEYKSGVTAFWLAASYGHLDCLKELKDSGANIMCTHSENMSNALHVSILKKNYKVSFELIMSGYPLDEKMKIGTTALMIACSQSTTEAANIGELLIQKGANINYVSKSGLSALGICVERENKPMLQYLVSKGAHIFNEDMSIRNMSPFFISICH